ncbi:hypothetical protein NKG94_46745 [Micromonospora sp. M12]
MPPRSTCTGRPSPRACPRNWTTRRPRCGTHPVGRAADLGGGGGRVPAALDAHDFVEIHTRRWSAPPRRAGRTCSRWTGSAGPRTWPSHRSSTSS